MWHLVKYGDDLSLPLSHRVTFSKFRIIVPNVSVDWFRIVRPRVRICVQTLAIMSEVFPGHTRPPPQLNSGKTP
jgi:hypothetical protein